MDLLWHLVRKHEIDVREVALGRITQQFLDSLEALQVLDVDDVGDFIDLAGLLVEYKSRSILPSDPGEDPEFAADPREDLVARLLFYKQYRDAAGLLDDQFRQWQQRFSRVEPDLPERRLDIAEQPIREVELWDLVSAFGRMLRDNAPPREENIHYDETPIQMHMARVHALIAERGRVAFSQLFTAGMHKSTMIGIFLAILEMVRHHHAQTEQEGLSGEIWIGPGVDYNPDIATKSADEYEGRLAIPPGDPASLIE
jgi:segregation and condensation protein A